MNQTELKQCATGLNSSHLVELQNHRLHRDIVNDFLALQQGAKEAGIEMPLVPGMKIITSKKQLTRLPSVFHIDIPEELTDRMLAAKDRAEEIQVGVDWAYKQSLELLNAGIPFLHFYIMQNTRPFLSLMDKLKKKL